MGFGKSVLQAVDAKEGKQGALLHPAYGLDLKELLIERGHGRLFAAPAMQVVHSDVQINVATRSFHAQHHRFGSALPAKPSSFM